MIEAQGEGQPSGLCEKQRKPQDWFKPRGYQHLDTPVGIRFANKATQPDFVARHSFTPLIHYVKRTKRYKPENGKTEFKNRSIMYASHRDACILSCYANKLNHALNAYYTANDLSDCVIAYRKLEKANYDFAADVQVFAREKSPCVILCFDVTDFFGSLDHRLLKQRLKEILSVSTLSSDWYQIFRTVAKYRYINKEDLQKHPVFGERMKGRSLQAIGKVNEIIAADISACSNDTNVGIPQGTPISAALANLYMIKFDATLHKYCKENGILYRRYSDDILLVCPAGIAKDAEIFFISAITSENLEINENKTERHPFDPSAPEAFQYLGFNIAPDGTTIRPSSLSRQWRKLRKGIKKIRRAGERAIAEGTSDKIFTKKLRRRFAPVPVRNFSSYARRSGKALNEPSEPKILKQVRRMERFLENEIAKFKNPPEA